MTWWAWLLQRAGGHMLEPADVKRPVDIAIWSSRPSFQRSASTWIRYVGGRVVGSSPIRDNELLASAEAVLVDMETLDGPTYATLKAVCRRFPRLAVVASAGTEGQGWGQRGNRPGLPTMVPAPLQAVHVEALAQLLRATPPQSLLTLQEMAEILLFQEG